ncbi:MAG: PQQ-binding-like beta-propeller repeat protein, partial [Pseudomonadales bacterium]
MASLTMVTACTDSQNASPANVADSQPASTAGAGEDWTYYFGDSGGTKYSRLTQITRENVGQLEEVWTYEVPETGRTQTTPIIVDGTMYVVSAQQKVIALDAATGEEQWIFDSGVGTGGASRGLTWWTDGEQNKLFSAASTYIYAIDPSTGTAISSFGDNGRIDLRENLRGPAEDN